MNNIEKTGIRSKEHLDEWMRLCIGGSWDYKGDRKYPEIYPCLLVMSKDRQSWGFVYPYDLEAL